MILHLNKILKIQRLKFGKIKHEKNRGDRDEASGWKNKIIKLQNTIDESSILEFIQPLEINQGRGLQCLTSEM